MKSVGDYVRETEAEFVVSTSAYSDERLFVAEMNLIFGRTWVYLGHESEVANPGDFKSTWIGRQPVILVRDSEGEIRAFRNFCRHRGATLCRSEYGNARAFVCPYHGWAYKTNGQLSGVTDRSRYPGSKTPSDKNLIPIPRVEFYKGLIFGCFDPLVEPLAEFLGGAMRHIDLWLGRAAGGRYRVTPAHKYMYEGNWKFQSENSVDGYHGGITHRSALNTFRKFEQHGIGSVPYFASGVHQEGVTRGFPNGHSTLEFGAAALVGGSPEAIKSYTQRIQALFGADADEILANRHILIFPNLIIMDGNIRIVQPISTNLTEVYSYCVTIENAPDELNSFRIHDVQLRIGTMGMVGADDIEIFAANQTGIAGCQEEWLLLSRGHSFEKVDGETNERIGAYSDEVPQRSFWRKWADMISADDREALA